MCRVLCLRVVAWDESAEFTRSKTRKVTEYGQTASGSYGLDCCSDEVKNDYQPLIELHVTGALSIVFCQSHLPHPVK